MAVNELIAAPAPTEGAFVKQFDLLKLELTLIDSAIRSTDEIMKNVKQWAIIAWTGGVGLALGNQSLKASVWATVFVPLTFWMVDGSYRRIQRSFVVRIHEISNFVNSPEFLEAASGNRTFDFPVMKMRSKTGKRTTWLRVMVFRTVALLYVLMIASSLLLAWLVSRGLM